MRGRTVVDRMRDAVRAYYRGPILSSDPNAADFFGAQSRSSTGLIITESNALTYSAVWSAVQLISSQMGNLPLEFYRKQSDGGKQKWEKHPLYRLIHDRPNPYMSSMTLRETMQGHVLLWGNAYAEIQRNGTGQATALWMITPDRVTPYWTPLGELQYRVLNPNADDSYIDAADMLHIVGPNWDGTCGYSLVQKMRESIGLGLAAERFGGSFYGNGTAFGGVIASKGPRPDDRVVENDRKALNSRHQGVDRAHQFLLLYGDATYTRMGIAPNEAQFLETRQFQVDEVARWFNVPPHKLKQLARATYDTIEHQNIEYYIDCLAPWIQKWEQELSEKLISPLERTQQALAFNVEALLRGDSQTRGELQSKQFSIAAFTPNEIRDTEHRNRIQGGDDAFVPLNVIPLPIARQYWQSTIDLNEAKAKQALAPPPEPGPTPAQRKEWEDKIADAIYERDLARATAQREEAAKDLAVAEKADADKRAAILADSLAIEQSSHAEQRDDWQRGVEILTQQRDEARTDAERAGKAKDEAQQKVADLAAEAVRLQGALETEQRDRKSDMAIATERIGAFIADAKTAQQERDTAVALEADAKEALTRMTAQAKSLGEDLVTLQKDLTDVEDAQAVLMADFQRACDEAEDLTKRAETAEAVTAELRVQISALTDSATNLTGELTAAKEQAGRAEVARDIAEQKALAHADMAAQHEARSKALEARIAATQQAIGKVLRYDVGCLVARESDRARKSARTREKMQAWVDSFYELHEDVCRTALRPAITAWLASTGSDRAPDRVLDRAIPGFLGTAIRQMRGMVNDAEPETLNANLEKLLRRWETERPDLFMNQLTNEAA